jgi:hypothetical protein
MKMPTRTTRTTTRTTTKQSLEPVELRSRLKMFEKKFAKKVRKYYKLSEGRGGEGREGGELSFQCLRQK